MSDAMTTDLYEVTMALLYLREGLTRPATFSLFVRDVPPDRGFLVAAGLESVLGYLSGFRVDAGDVEVFASVLDRPPDDVEPLLGLTFTGDVRAVPEGRIALAGEPLVEITAPLPQKCALACPVLPDDSHQLSGGQIQAHSTQHMASPVSLVHITHTQDDVVLRHLPPPV